jgi:hypothetical protein
MQGVPFDLGRFYSANWPDDKNLQGGLALCWAA